VTAVLVHVYVCGGGAAAGRERRGVRWGLLKHLPGAACFEHVDNVRQYGTRRILGEESQGWAYLMSMAPRGMPARVVQARIDKVQSQ